MDDDEHILAILQEIFEGEGYTVLLAGHGQAALELLEMSSTQKPGLIFLDLTMPVMDGPAFLSELQRSHPEVFAHTPIFVITARGSIPPLTIKTTGFLKKPLDLDELSKIAARYCL